MSLSSEILTGFVSPCGVLQGLVSGFSLSFEFLVAGFGAVGCSVTSFTAVVALTFKAFPLSSSFGPSPFGPLAFSLLEGCDALLMLLLHSSEGVIVLGLVIV